jgi:D-alanyl-D-alanine carboxypeptidase
MRLRRVWHASTFIPLAGLLAVAIPAADAAPAITASHRYASIVVDADTGRVIAATNADNPVYPASLTKIMTLYMVFDALKRGELRRQQPIRVSYHATAAPPSKLGLRGGDSIAVEDAVLGLVTKSANDAAVALAEALAGSEVDFARAMTRRARSLGMDSTVFANASGLPHPDQVTTARDMAVLAMAILRDHPAQYRYFATESFGFRGQMHRNHNRLLGQYDGVDGIKTGFINKSGFNLVVSARRDGQRVIAVVFGGDSPRARDAHAAQLLDRGFDQLTRPGRALEPAAGDVVAVADRPALPPAAGEKPSKPKPAKARPAKRPNAEEIERNAIEAVGNRNWAVQIGSFKTTAQAERATHDALLLAPGQLALARIEVSQVKTPEGSRHRARLVGLTEQQSRQVCKLMKQKKQTCALVQPGGRVDMAAGR